MASRRWLRGQSDVTVSLSAPRLLTTLGASRSTGPFDEVRRVYGDFATALPPPRSWPPCATPPSTSSGSAAAPTSPPPIEASATDPPTSSMPSPQPDRRTDSLSGIDQRIQGLCTSPGAAAI